MPEPMQPEEADGIAALWVASGWNKLMDMYGGINGTRIAAMLGAKMLAMAVAALADSQADCEVGLNTMLPDIRRDMAALWSEMYQNQTLQ